MELKLSNGDTLYFVEKLKGKHYRAIKRMSVEVQVEMGGGRFAKSNEIDRMKVDLASYTESQIRMFVILVEKIVKKDGSKIEPTMEYFDELDLDDAKKVDETLEKFLEKVENNKKK